ncbi:MAG TPA: hypothetical protein VJR89_43205 [Polyangiales bacterium]|nr:hypothetical protein [Polyangiales bacterium]
MWRAVRTRWLLLALCAACTQDFSAFGFQQPRGTTRRDPAREPDAASAPATDAESSEPSQPRPSADAATAAMPDAAADASAERPHEPDGASAGRSAPTPDVPSRPADHVDSSDAGQADDAGDPTLDMCKASWPELPFTAVPVVTADAADLPPGPPPAAACQSCACDACGKLILDCLHVGSPEERGLCRDLLACALRERCQEHDCYCASNGCNFRAGIGDGSCAEEINAAARGTRSRVNALLNANPPDRNEPLIRATQAIACIYGVHPASPGPTLSGACELQCQ